MHTIWEIKRLATMLAGLIAPQLRLGYYFIQYSEMKFLLAYTKTYKHQYEGYQLVVTTKNEEGSAEASVASPVSVPLM